MPSRTRYYVCYTEETQYYLSTPDHGGHVQGPAFRSLITSKHPLLWLHKPQQGGYKLRHIVFWEKIPEDVFEKLKEMGVTA
ncbi:hypothetical protein LCGC14_0163810 [marine sediment metagenome]|uniref:Uncharacterized protein n=1 Tax=marine sediment metagenome TaxID=412755 RepID=A0A0F9VAD4_9ZZZZ